MSDLDLLRDEDLAVERETAKEPAKVWRAFFDVIGGHEIIINDKTFVGPGIMNVGPFPSKDAADTIAVEILASARRKWWLFWLPTSIEPLKYLGAYPEGERP